jgi:hypothetical protein
MALQLRRIIHKHELKRRLLILISVTLNSPYANFVWLANTVYVGVAAVFTTV